MRTGCRSRDDVRRRLRCATPNCSGWGTQRADACGHHFCDGCASSPQSHCSECCTPVHPTSPPPRSFLEEVGRLIAEGRCEYCVSVFEGFMQSLKPTAAEVATEAPAPPDLTALSLAGFPSEVLRKFERCDQCFNTQTSAMLWWTPSVMLDQGTKSPDQSTNTGTPPAATHFAFLSRPISPGTERGGEGDVVGGAATVLPPPALVNSAAATPSSLNRSAAAAAADPSSSYSGHLMLTSPPSHGATPPGSSRAAVAPMALVRSASASSSD